MLASGEGARLTGKGGALESFKMKRRKTLARMRRQKRHFPESFAHLFGK